jgi:2-methylcitrate dehydratase PrpD
MRSQTSHSSSSSTAELSRFLVGLSNKVDPRLLDLATERLADTTASMVFGSEQPWARAVIDHALSLDSKGKSTVVGNPAVSVNPVMAALANGTSAHAFELDDVHEEAINHPGAVVVPVALALAEDLNRSGHDLLEAIVIGYEAMGRAGIAVGPASHMLSGFHPTSMSGVFGAAAAAGRLLNFDQRQFNHAFGIASSMASGTMEFAASGGMTKRLHAGRAAEGGLTAALLAARGFEGPEDGLAGRYGFCRIFSNEPQIELLTQDLGTRWMMDEITVKPYAACSDIHPLIQATIELQLEHGFRVEDVQEIHVEAPLKAVMQNDMDGTASVMAAQYSAQFNIAAALLADPADPDTYREERLSDPAISAMQAKVLSIRPSPEFEATYAWKMGGRVQIDLVDGTKLIKTVHGQKGSMHDPLGVQELTSKFERLTKGRSNPSLDSLLWGVGRAEGIGELTNALRLPDNN